MYFLMKAVWVNEGTCLYDVSSFKDLDSLYDYLRRTYTIQELRDAMLDDLFITSFVPMKLLWVGPLFEIVEEE